MRCFISVFIALFSICTFAKASEYKLDCNSLEIKFNQAVEVSLLDSKLLDNTRQELTGREINQNIAGVLAICCGTFGIHRFYMAHTDAGLKHLATTVLVGILGGSTIYVLSLTSPGSSTGTVPSNVGSSLALVTYSLAYCISGTHQLYSIVEGIMYLTMPEEKFQSRIVKDPRFFAAFSRN